MDSTKKTKRDNVKNVTAQIAIRPETRDKLKKIADQRQTTYDRLINEKFGWAE